MKIASFQSEIYRVPLTEAWGSSNYAFTSLEFVIVSLKSDSGLTGTGWTFSVGNGAAAFKSMIDYYLAPKVLGQDVFQVERLWSRMWLETHDVGSAGVTTHAIAAIDIAIWDLLGQALRQPLHRLLGGYRDSLPGYGSGVNLHLDRDALLAQMESFQSQGYRAFKMKIGKDDPHEDLERVMAVRALVGNAARLMVDANQKWHPSEVIRRVDMLKPANLFWLEEPTLSDDVDGHALIRSKLVTPVAVGESLYTKYQFAHQITRGACDIVQPDVYRVGGITEFMKIVKMAESHNIPVAPHFGMELVAHLGCAVPNILCFEGLRGAGLSEMGIIERPLKVTDGTIQPDDTPGHGVRFDMGVLAQYRQTPERLAREQVTTRTDV
ncbi:mandelate racemase/muconate lactonizing enzyme family protein [Paraburkholderia aspalathi]|uniref:L-alanine-DL-glutamate epimerase n=1 Tax=Paraburkholderia aspalathi TaxID=1324617 RepID=A0A1I7DAA9_9BURK|nr:mandelate racemase/muconate lactonizing enzyme family protein [Paraburkholderia aspalathi]SFU08567.1 L-alanine-DL-glutamate epimerase [Paraburkholderia aspalathi]